MNRAAELTAVVSGLLAVAAARRISGCLNRSRLRSTSWSEVLESVRLLASESGAQEFLRSYVDMLRQAASFARFQAARSMATLIPMATLYAASSGVGSLISPGTLSYRNPLRLWMNDLQFIFCVSASCGAIAAALWNRRQKRE